MPDPKTKWNRIYAESTGPGKPAAVITDNLSLLPNSGLALDIACGTGGNALFLAEQGLEVEAWDISDVAITKLQQLPGTANISARSLDITPVTLADKHFDVIVCCHYLDRELIPAIQKALNPGGILLFQTFTQNKVLDIGPSNPKFLLKKDELPDLMSRMQIVQLRDESANTNPDHPLAGRAYIVARRN